MAVISRRVAPLASFIAPGPPKGPVRGPSCPGMLTPELMFTQETWDAQADTRVTPGGLPS